MATDRQLAANRANALKSTGPQSEWGKAVSRRNALTHGLTAEELLLEGEDPVVFELLREELFYELAPESTLEKQLVHRLVSLVWRLRRMPALEAALMSWIAFRQKEIHDSDHSVNAHKTPDTTYYGHHLGLRPGRRGHTDAANDRLRLGRALAAAMDKDLTGKLGRHEAHIMRQLQQTRAELFELKAERAQRQTTERPLHPIATNDDCEPRYVSEETSASKMMASNPLTAERPRPELHAEARESAEQDQALVMAEEPTNIEAAGPDIQRSLANEPPTKKTPRWTAPDKEVGGRPGQGRGDANQSQSEPVRLVPGFTEA